MNKRQQSIDELTPEQRINKERDIRICLASAKTQEAKERYSAQLDYIIKASVQQLTLNFWEWEEDINEYTDT